MYDITPDMIKIISEIRTELDTRFERARKRKMFEDLVISIIQERPGKLTREDIEWIMQLIDFDYHEYIHYLPLDNPQSRRFGSLFAGPNRRRILTNDIEMLNELFIEIFWNENIDKADEFIDNIQGIGDGFISLLLYLKNREKYNIMLPQTIEGIELIFNQRISSGSFKERYNKFNELASQLKRICNLKPQEVDIILVNIKNYLEEN